MTLLHLIIRSLRYHWRTGLAILAGVAVATAVITGSLLVGDSVNGSVRDIALARLGDIDAAMVTPTFFRDGLAADIAGVATGRGKSNSIIPLIMLQGAVKQSTSQISVPNVNVIGVDAGFWRCYHAGLAPNVSGRAVAINASLANDLHVVIGNYVLLTVARPSDAPNDSLFARHSREDTTRALRLQVAAILPDNGVGGFALQAGATTPRNIFIPRDWLAERLDLPAQVNALLAVGIAHHGADTDALQRTLAEKCTLNDYGLSLENGTEVSSGMAVPAMNNHAPDLHGRDARATGGTCVNLHSNGIVLSQALVHAAQQAATECRARAVTASVYLAISIAIASHPDHRISYAILAGLDPDIPLSLSAGHPIVDDDGLLLNDWAVHDLGARLGDRLTVSYLTPSWSGIYRNVQRDFSLRGIVSMNGISSDAGLAPNFEGITSVQRIEDWNPPFPIDISRVTTRDEAYWTQYHTTPKAYISLPAVRALWQSGDAGPQADWVTTVCLLPQPATDLSVWSNEFSTAFLRQFHPQDAGFVFLPVRRQAMASAESPTDFGQLFLAMSMFLVLSAIGMAGMLMRLMIERRASTIGIMQACGLSPKVIFCAMIGEGAVLSVGGVIIGVPIGLFYARELIALLATHWNALTGPATLWLHVTNSSLASGVITGILAGLLATAWGTGRMVRGQTLPLLSGGDQSDALDARVERTGLLSRWWGIFVLLIVAAACILLATVWRMLSPAIAFFLAGFLLLLAGLCWCNLLLDHSGRGRTHTPSWGWLALRNAAAQRKRSLLTIGLLACASFILVTVAANSRDYGHIDMADKHSGTGGFSLRTVASVPITYDFGSQSGREQLGFSAEDGAAFSNTQVLSFLMSPGGDISCLNITRPPTPRVLGVPPEMIARGGFTLETVHPSAAPWTLLDKPLKDGCIPAFGDADSVRWSLHSDLGEVYTVSDAEGRPRRLRFVGLLTGSIFAGELLVSRDNFKSLYPAVGAPRVFLLAAPSADLPRVTDALRANMSDLGLEVTTTRELLTRYLSVQQTYLSTFLTLGRLGLLLGMLGMVAAVLHSAFDRRKEFALLSAIGFRRGALVRVLLLEHVSLLLGGIASGTLAALVACLPQMTAPDAKINWLTVIALLTSMVFVGVVSCAITGWCAIGERLLEGLRSE